MFANRKQEMSRKLKSLSLAAAFVAVSLTLVAGGHLAAGGENTEEPESTGSFSVLRPVDGEDAGNLSSDVKLLLSLSQGDLENSPVTAIGRVPRSSGSEITVLEQGQSICVVEFPPGLSNCGDAEMVRAGDLYVAAPESCSRVKVLGLVPDGVDVLEVHQSGRPAGTIEVKSNTYETVVAAEPASLQSPDGSVRLSIPLDSFAAMSGDCSSEGGG